MNTPFRLDAQNYLLLASAIVNFMLALFIYFGGKKKKTNLIYTLIALCVSAWAFGMFMYRGAVDSKTIIWWTKFYYIASGITPLSLLFFVLWFPNRRISTRPRIHLWIIYFFVLIIAIIFIISPLFSNFIVVKVIPHRYQEHEIFFGSGLNIWGIYLISYFILAFVILINKFRTSAGLVRLQIKYVLLGAAISTLIGIITNHILPLFFGNPNYAWIGPSGTIIMVGFIAYAVTRYRLMDIRLVVARTITFGFIVLLLTIIYAALSTLIATFFESWVGIKSNILVGIIIAILVVIGYQPLRKLIEGITNTFLFKKAYNPDQLLSQIAEVTASILNLDQLLTSICGTLDEAFHVQKIGIALLTKKNKGKKLEIAYQSGFANGEAEKLVGYPNVASIFHRELKQIRGILVIDEIDFL